MARTALGRVYARPRSSRRPRDEAARAAEAEYVGIATALAKQVPYPLKMIWTRETDIQRDRYRPFYYDQVAAGLDAGGRIADWTHKVTGSSVLARCGPTMR